MQNYFLGLIVILASLQTGCSLFLGNVKPVEEKSESYGTLDLSKVDPDWVRLDPSTVSSGDEPHPQNESGISDLVFQSKKAASIVSLNSACKSYKKSDSPQDLHSLTRELLLGISNIKTQESVEITLEKIPALQTTTHGKLNGEEMMIRTVVLQRTNCVYDLMYIARPDKFKEHENDFSRFVSSLRLR